MIVFSPTIYREFEKYNVSDLIIEDNIDFWYDSLNDCYSNKMPIDMVCTYIEAINDDDTE